jgi:hypothetical protein
MGNLVDAVEGELRPAAPARTKVLLDTFRRRLSNRRISPSRKSFEQELETFLQSTSSLRTAAQRHIRKTAPPLIRAAEAALRRAGEILAQAPNQQGGANGRQPLRSVRVRKSAAAASRRSP